MTLFVRGKMFVRFVHHIVSDAFLGPRPKGLTVNHINGIKTDNRVENLEYMTAEENFREAVNRGVMAPSTAKKRKLTALAVEEIRGLAASGENLSRLGRRFGVDRATIRDAVLRKTWRHI